MPHRPRKQKWWMPTRPYLGEGSNGRGRIDRCTRLVHRGSGNSMPEKGLRATGEIRSVGIATRTAPWETDEPEVGGGHKYCRSRVMPVEGEAPACDMLATVRLVSGI